MRCNLCVMPDHRPSKTGVNALMAEHPRLEGGQQAKTWMAGSSPAMTKERMGLRGLTMNSRRPFCAALVLSGALVATPAFAEMVTASAPKIDAGDTAWMIAATALVLLMTIPGLALFYCGMVRKKNVLATMAQSVASVGIVSILWAIVGYSLAFSGDAPALGNFERVLLLGIGLDSVSPFAKTIPESLFMIYQMTFAIITVALVSVQSRTVCGSRLFCYSRSSGC